MDSNPSSSPNVSMTVDQALSQAIAQHQAGQIQQAESLYRAILQADPQHIAANFHLGVLAMQLGQPVAAQPHFLMAGRRQADHLPYWLAYLDAQLSSGQAEQARSSYLQERQAGRQGAVQTMFGLSWGWENAAPPAATFKALQPGKAETDNMLSLFNAGRYLEAAASAFDLSIRFPANGFVWKVLGVLLGRMGLHHYALTAARMSAHYGQNDAGAYNNLGNAWRKLGRLNEARSSLIAALKLKPDFAEAHNNLGNVLSDMGKDAEAVASLRKALQLKPGMAETHNNLGNLLLRGGQAEAAVASFSRAIQLNPDYADAHGNLGSALRTLGRLEQAETSLRRAVQLAPAIAECHNNLGICLQDRGSLDEAAACFQQALRCRADYAEAYYNLGNLLLQSGRAMDALGYFQQAVQLKPTADAYYNQGNSLLQLERWAEAEQAYRAALAIKPQAFNALNNLGLALRNQGRIREAIEVFTQALQQQPENAALHSNLSVAQGDAGLLDDALASLEKAVALEPENAGAMSNLGSLLMTLGRDVEGEQWLSRAIAQAPQDAVPLSTALLLLPYHREDPRFAGLDALYENRAALALTPRIQLDFAVGKVREGEKNYEAAFAAYEEGNRLSRQGQPFDEVADQKMVDTLCAFYDTALFARAGQQALPDASQDERVPVFIVGMPRSGTSLLEQVLASQGELFGAGELTEMSRLAEQAVQLLRTGVDIVDLLPALRNLGRLYLDSVWQRAPHARFISDKMPENFFHLGLIHLMLPQARIIHARRDARDTCFSCYSILFRSGHAYSYDQQLLARRYLRYEQLMQHWQHVLPAGRILDIAYEDMVADLEVQARRLLDYLGLPWNPACLDFHLTQRHVHTASVSQVRQPLYASSVARWQRFESYLQPLLQVLESGESHPPV